MVAQAETSVRKNAKGNRVCLQRTRYHPRTPIFQLQGCIHGDQLRAVVFCFFLAGVAGE